VTLPALPPAHDVLSPQADDRWTLGLLEYVNDETNMHPKAYGNAFQIAHHQARSS